MQYQFPLVAIHKSGYTILLTSIDEVNQFLRDWGLWSNKLYVKYIFDIYKEEIIVNDWIVRDDLGQPVDVNDWINSNWPKQVSYWDIRRQKIAKAAEQGLPIPGIKSHKRHRTLLARDWDLGND